MRLGIFFNVSIKLSCCAVLGTLSTASDFSQIGQADGS